MRPTLCVLLVVLATACGPREVRVTMNPDNNSGQAGFAVVTDNGNKGITVTVETSAPEYEGPQNAHIHDGNCGEVGTVYAPLLNLEALKDKPGRVGSTSAGVLKKADGKLVTFETFATGEWIINVHDARDLGLYVSCGEIPRP